MKQQFILNALWKTIHPVCAFDCVQNMSNNAFRGWDEYIISINQDSRRKAPKNEKSFNAIPVTVLTKSTAIKDLIIYLHQTNVIWYNHTISGSTCKSIRSGWRAAASGRRDPFPLTPKLHHLVSKFFPLREWLKRGSPAQPCWENSATTVIPTDLLRERERALQQLGPQLLRLPCKWSWACFGKTWQFW